MKQFLFLVVVIAGANCSRSTKPPVSDVPAQPRQSRNYVQQGYDRQGYDRQGYDRQGTSLGCEVESASPAGPHSRPADTCIKAFSLKSLVAGGSSVDRARLAEGRLQILRSGGGAADARRRSAGIGVCTPGVNVSLALAGSCDGCEGEPSIEVC